MTHTTHGHHFSNWHHLFRHQHTEVNATDWRWGMALGIAFVVFGTIGLGMVVLMTLASIVFLGALVLIGGAAQVIQAFSIPTWRERLAHLLIGILYLFASWVMISDPLVASAVFTIMLAWALIIIGIFRVVVAVQNRVRHGWWWPLVAGFLSVALGVMILAQWPMTGLWVIGLFVCLEMIFHGWGLIALSWSSTTTMEKKA